VASLVKVMVQLQTCVLYSTVSWPVVGSDLAGQLVGA
jgi:hypothetical protein